MPILMVSNDKSLKVEISVPQVYFRIYTNMRRSKNRNRLSL